MTTGKFLQQLKCTIYGGGSELLNANEASPRRQIEMRACCGNQDARISICLRGLSSVSQTNFPHLDFSIHQSAAANLLIFATCNRKISRNFKCTNCHPENCSTAVLQHAREPPNGPRGLQLQACARECSLPLGIDSLSPKDVLGKKCTSTDPLSDFYPIRFLN
jgi:hypothetical protein